MRSCVRAATTCGRRRCSGEAVEAHEKESQRAWSGGRRSTTHGSSTGSTPDSACWPGWPRNNLVVSRRRGRGRRDVRLRAPDPPRRRQTTPSVLRATALQERRRGKPLCGRPVWPSLLPCPMRPLPLSNREWPPAPTGAWGRAPLRRNAGLAGSGLSEAPPECAVSTAQHRRGAKDWRARVRPSRVEDGSEGARRPGIKATAGSQIGPAAVSEGAITPSWPRAGDAAVIGWGFEVIGPWSRRRRGGDRRRRFTAPGPPWSGTRGARGDVTARRAGHTEARKQGKEA